MPRSPEFLAVLKRIGWLMDEAAVLWSKEEDHQGYGYPFSDQGRNDMEHFNELARMFYRWRAAEEVASAAMETLKEKLAS
jgi:hypothetical protein